MFNSPILQTQYGLQLLEPWIFHQTPTLIKKSAIRTILMTSYRVAVQFDLIRPFPPFFARVVRCASPSDSIRVRFPFVRSRGATRGARQLWPVWPNSFISPSFDRARSGPRYWPVWLGSSFSPFSDRAARCASPELRAAISLLINARLPVAFQLSNIVRPRIVHPSQDLKRILRRYDRRQGDFKGVTAVLRRTKRVPENSVEIYALG